MKRLCQKSTKTQSLYLLYGQRIEPRGMWVSTQAPLSFSDPPSMANVRVHCLWEAFHGEEYCWVQPTGVQEGSKVSRGTTIYRVSRQLFLVLIFHSGCNLLKQGPGTGGIDTPLHLSPCYLMPSWIFTHI